jgi:hypothetical protein
VEDDDVDEEETSESPPSKKRRQSGRDVTPEKVDVIMSEANDGTKLTTKTLFANISELIGTGIVKLYVESVLKRGQLKLAGETCNTSSSIYKLYAREGFTGAHLQMGMRDGQRMNYVNNFL